MARQSISVSGNVANFESAGKTEFRDLKLYFGPAQKGTGDPSPENIRPIAGHNYIPFTHTSKNLWNDRWFAEAGWELKTSGTYAGYYNGNMQALLKYMRGTGGRYGIFHKLRNLGRVRISFDALRTSGTVRIYFWYEGDDGWTNHSGNIQSSGHKTYVSASGKNCVGLSFYTNVGVSSVAWGLKNVQIEISNTETAYEIATSDERIFSLPTSGKNLWNELNTSYITGYYRTETGGMSLSDNYKVSIDYTPIAPSTTYTLQYNKTATAGYGVQVQTYDENFDFIERLTVTARENNEGITGVISNQFTTSADTRYMSLTIPIANIENIQLELGSTATEYEPFVPVYGGYIDLVTGDIMATWMSAIYDGSDDETWWVSSNIRYLITQTNCKYVRTSAAYIKSNKLKSIQASGLGSTSENVCFINGANSIGIAKASINNDIPAFKEWLSENPIQIVYQLATPVPIGTLAPEQLKTYRGANNMWSIGVAPDQTGAGSIDVSFDFLETKDMLDARKRMIANSAPHIETETGAPAEFITDLSAKAKNTIISIMPNQDLHGLSAPFPEGVTRNLLDPKKITKNVRLTNVGKTTTYGAWAVSDWIPCLPNTDYRIMGAINSASGYAVCFYDSEKTFLRYGVESGTNPVDTIKNSGDDAAYLRATVVLEDVYSKACVMQTSTADPFEIYGNICPIEGYTGAKLYNDPVFGKEIWWNQCASYTADTVTGGGVTFTPNGDGSYTLTGDGTATYRRQLQTISSIEVGDILYYTHGANIAGSSSTFAVVFSRSGGNLAEAYNIGGRIIKASQEYNQFSIRTFSDFRPPEGGLVLWPQWINLTKMLGKELANEVFNLGATEAVEWFKNLFPKNYYPRNLGTYTCVSAVNNDIYDAISTDWENEAGTVYKGSLNMKTGLLSITHIMRTTDWLKGRTWYTSTSGSGDDKRTYLRCRVTSIMESGLTDLVCSHFPYTGTGTTIYANEVKNMAANYYNLSFCAPDLFTTVAEFKAWLDAQEANGTPVQLLMWRETPLTYQLTPAQIKAFKGANKVFTDIGGNVAVEFWKH